MRLEPVKWYEALNQTPAGNRYKVNFLARRPEFGEWELLSVVIVPSPFGAGVGSSSGRAQHPIGKGSEVYPNGVFRGGKLIAGYGDNRVIVLLSRTQYQIIQLSAAEQKEVATRGMAATVWTTKVEPEMERAMAEWYLRREGRSLNQIANLDAQSVQIILKHRGTPKNEVAPPQVPRHQVPLPQNRQPIIGTPFLPSP